MEHDYVWRIVSLRIAGDTGGDVSVELWGGDGGEVGAVGGWDGNAVGWI